MLEQIIKGEHPQPIKALCLLYCKGEISREDIQYKYRLPVKVRAMMAERIKELDEYITAAEATAKWGLNESTLRVTFNRHSEQFRPDEYKKSSKAWLVKLSAMYRIYGEPKE